jgi:hypothetical protein
MSTAQLQAKARNLSKRLQELSQEISIYFPELLSKRSLSMVIQPERWLGQAKSLDPNMQTTIERFMGLTEQLESSVDPSTIAMDAEASVAKMIGGEYAASESLHKWQKNAEDVESGLNFFCDYGVAPAIVGEDSVLEQVQRHMWRRASEMKAPRKPRSAPSWFRQFCKQLNDEITNSACLSSLRPTQKLRVIEFTLHAHTRYHGLQVPDSWGSREIERSLT